MPVVLSKYLMLFFSSSKAMAPEYFRTLSPQRMPALKQLAEGPSLTAFYDRRGLVVLQEGHFSDESDFPSSHLKTFQTLHTRAVQLMCL